MMSTQCTTPNCLELPESIDAKHSSVRGVQLKATNANVFSLAHRWLSSAKEFVTKRYDQYMDRLAFQQLLKLDEHMLKDIGVTRADVIYANNLPVSVDAAKEIECIARRNKVCR